MKWKNIMMELLWMLVAILILTTGIYLLYLGLKLFVTGEVWWGILVIVSDIIVGLEIWNYFKP